MESLHVCKCQFKIELYHMSSYVCIIQISKTASIFTDSYIAGMEFRHCKNAWLFKSHRVLG